MQLNVVIVLFIIFIFLRFIVNCFRMKRMLFLRNVFKDFYENKKSDLNHEYYSVELKELIVSAGIEDSFVPIIRQAGYGYGAQINLSVLDNCFSEYQDIVISMSKLIDRSIGVYRKRMLETINPIFWIDFIVFLPKKLLDFIGFKLKSKYSRTVSVLYWFISVVYIIYSDEVNQIVKSLIKSVIDQLTAR